MTLYVDAQTTHVIPSSYNGANIQTPRTDNWTAFQNPASLIQSNQVQVGLQYENRYFLAALNTIMLQVAYCNPWVNVGFGVSFFGYSKYQEWMTGIALARSFGRFSIGLQGNYIGVYCGDEIKYRGTFIPQIGATINIINHWTIGLSTFNPFWQRLPIEDETERQLPILYSIGSSYHFANHFRWDVQGDWDVSSTWRVATAFEWQAMDKLVTHAGVEYRQRLIGDLGFGIIWDRLRFDANIRFDPALGVLCLARIHYAIVCDH